MTKCKQCHQSRTRLTKNWTMVGGIFFVTKHYIEHLFLATFCPIFRFTNEINTYISCYAFIFLSRFCFYRPFFLFQHFQWWHPLSLSTEIRLQSNVVPNKASLCCSSRMSSGCSLSLNSTSFWWFQQSSPNSLDWTAVRQWIRSCYYPSFKDRLCKCANNIIA